MSKLRWMRFAGVLFVALALIPTGAHLLALPNKIDLVARDYLTVQQIYRGWAFTGVFTIGAVLATGALAFFERKSPRAFVPSLIAFLCIVASQIVFWTLDFPANRQTQNWVTLPTGWETLRARWELGHALGAALTLAALVMLLIARLRDESSGSRRTVASDTGATETPRAYGA